MKVTAYKCPHTGKLFEDYGEYTRYAAGVRRTRLNERKKLTARTEWEQWFADEKARITEVAQIPEWVVEHQGKIYNARFNRYDSQRAKPVFKSLAFHSMMYSKLVSNSHRCPKGGVTNWWQNNDHPRGYPGWTGTVNAVMNTDARVQVWSDTKILDFIGLYTGTGGGGPETMQYSLTIFLADWPGLKSSVDQMEQDAIVKRLSR